MAQTVGASRSSVGREAAQASAEQLKSLREKRSDTIEILSVPCWPLWNLLSWTGSLANTGIDFSITEV
jgi:hypothetical protein